MMVKVFKKHVTVKGAKYKIKIVKELYDSVTGEPIMGSCDPVKKVICLKEDMDENEFLKTFLHELLHAVVFEVSLYQVIDEKIVEIIVDNMGNVIYDTILKPLLVARINELRKASKANVNIDENKEHNGEVNA